MRTVLRRTFNSWWYAGDSGRETFRSRLLHPVLVRSIKKLTVETSPSWYGASNWRQAATLEGTDSVACHNFAVFVISHQLCWIKYYFHDLLKVKHKTALQLLQIDHVNSTCQVRASELHLQGLV